MEQWFACGEVDRYLALVFSLAAFSSGNVRSSNFFLYKDKFGGGLRADVGQRCIA